MFLEDWFEHAVLKEDASLNEAAPRKAKDLGINPDTPPDLNNPNSDNKQPPQKDDNPSPSNNTKKNLNLIKFLIFLQDALKGIR